MATPERSRAAGTRAVKPVHVPERILLCKWAANPFHLHDKHKPLLSPTEQYFAHRAKLDQLYSRPKTRLLAEVKQVPGQTPALQRRSICTASWLDL